MMDSCLNFKMNKSMILNRVLHLNHSHLVNILLKMPKKLKCKTLMVRRKIRVPKNLMLKASVLQRNYRLIRVKGRQEEVLEK